MTRSIRRTTRVSLVPIALVVALLAPLSTVALAASPRITQGEAAAVLHAYTNGGRTVGRHAAEVADGAPADDLGSHGAIRPFAGSPWDGATFCSLDYHTIVMAVIDGSSADFPSTRTDIQASLSVVQVAFTVNGEPLDSTRTPIKEFLQPPSFLDWGLAFQQGRVMAPSDLPVGSYTLAVHVTDPIYGDFDDGITFYIDDASCG